MSKSKHTINLSPTMTTSYLSVALKSTFHVDGIETCHSSNIKRTTNLQNQRSNKEIEELTQQCHHLSIEADRDPKEKASKQQQKERSARNADNKKKGII